MIDLYPHNRAAYESVMEMLAETGKAAVVHPTGTGKSFIGFKLCLEHRDKTVCWLSPSEYIFKTQLENLKADSGDEPQNIRFYTYAKLMLLNQQELEEIQPDFIILDEFHRCGAEFWGQGVRNLLEQYPDTPILGLSATNVRYLDNQRDMADELFDGNVAARMSLGEAIVRGILQPPKYVLSVFSYQKDLERYQKRVYNAQSRIVRDAGQKYLEALRRALEMADGLDVIFQKHMPDPRGKYILFCASREHMDEMRRMVPKWFGALDPEPHIYNVYSSDPETSRVFGEFKADQSAHLKLLFCIDMLNEGIHVEDISGVVLFRPTVSPIVYKQQIGRAMSAGCRKDAVIFDIVNNIGNLYSISAIQEEMDQVVRYLRENGQEEEIVRERFRIIDEVRDCRTLFDQLEQVLVASWDCMYQEAKAYYSENGDLAVPSHYITSSGYNLGHWLVTQRSIRSGSREGTLTREQIEKLDAIGMCWLQAPERIWEAQFAMAKAHFEATGGLLPPYQTSSLKNWIYRQRKKYSEKALSPEAIRRLNAIGMVWELDDAWERMYALASDYYEDNGNLDIPARFVTDAGEPLGQWYRKCVSECRKGILSPERRQRLEAIGFLKESVQSRTWMKYYAEAEKYRDRHGDLNVHVDYVTESGLKLGTWISSQRYSCSQGRLSDQRKALLDAIGMQWQRFDGRWELGARHLADYLGSFGSANVPSGYITPDGFRLGIWVTTQRTRKSQGKLAPERIRRLEDLGFQWSGKTTGA